MYRYVKIPQQKSIAISAEVRSFIFFYVIYIVSG